MITLSGRRMLRSVLDFVSRGSGNRLWKYTKKRTFLYHPPNPIPERVTRSQFARPTRLPEFNPDIKYVSPCPWFLLFVLVLLVMCIWLDLPVFKIWGLGSTLRSRQAKLGQAKPSLQYRKPTKAFSATCLRGCWISLLLERGQDGLICSSTIDIIAAQICSKKQTWTTKWHNNVPCTYL